MSSDDLTPGAPLVVHTQGYTPTLWKDRGCIFFANLLSMFFGNEQQTEMLSREIKGADSYGGRLVPILGLLFGGGGNVLVLERQPDAALLEYFSSELGLKLPRIRVLSHIEYMEVSRALAHRDFDALPEWLDELSREPCKYLDGFVTDDTLSALAERLGKQTITSPLGSRHGNNKLLLHQHLHCEGLPVFETRLAHSPQAIGECLADLARLDYDEAVVKSQIGASGIGLVKLRTADDPDGKVPELFFHEGACMVQGWMRPGLHSVTGVRSPSVQMFLDEGNVYLYDLTEQILSEESIHQGNESPPTYLDDFPGLMEELFRQAGAAGRWLHGQGYRGTASTDFLVTVMEKPGSWQAYVCEINARVTGATYPSVLARHYLPRGAWLMLNLRLSKPLPGHTVLRLLREHSTLFHPRDPVGILPINFNLDDANLVDKGQFLCLGATTRDCHDMLQRAGRDLPVDWESVRD